MQTLAAVVAFSPLLSPPPTSSFHFYANLSFFLSLYPKSFTYNKVQPQEKVRTQIKQTKLPILNNTTKHFLYLLSNPIYSFSSRSSVYGFWFLDLSPCCRQAAIHLAASPTPTSTYFPIGFVFYGCLSILLFPNIIIYVLIYVLGDFSFDQIDWTSMISRLKKKSDPIFHALIATRTSISPPSAHISRMSTPARPKSPLVSLSICIIIIIMMMMIYTEQSLGMCLFAFSGWKLQSFFFLFLFFFFGFFQLQNGTNLSNFVNFCRTPLFPSRCKILVGYAYLILLPTCVNSPSFLICS